MITFKARGLDAGRDLASGFMLIEIMIAVVLLVIGSLGFMGAIFASQMMARQTKEQNRANAALVSAVEEFRREAMNDFVSTVERYSGETTYERKAKIGPGGEVVSVDVLTRMTTTDLDLNGEPVDSSTSTTTGSKNPHTTAATEADIATLYDLIAAKEGVVVKLQDEYYEAAARASRTLAAAESDRTLQRSADSYVADADAAKVAWIESATELTKLQTKHDTLVASTTTTDTTTGVAAPAPTVELATDSKIGVRDPSITTDTCQSRALFRKLVSLYRAGKITKQDAIARWKALGSKTLDVSTDGTVSQEKRTTLADGSATTVTASVDMTGATSETTVYARADGTTTASRWTVNEGISRTVSQHLDGKGNTETSITTTTLVDESVVQPGIVDLGLVCRIGKDAKVKMNLLVDETTLNPPVDMNGDGDFLDTNVQPRDMKASVLCIVVSWRGGAGMRKVETTTVVARGSIGATYR
jgi:Tfp pilus assembly protein PilV